MKMGQISVAHQFKYNLPMLKSIAQYDLMYMYSLLLIILYHTHTSYILHTLIFQVLDKGKIILYTTINKLTTSTFR